MRKIIFLLSTVAITPLLSQVQNADFSFGSAVGFGGALFHSSNTIALGFFDSGVFTSISGDIAVGNDPFGNHGYANHSFSSNPVPASAIGQEMYIKLSQDYGDAYITDSGWATISATTPPATPPLNAALIGHGNAGQISVALSGLDVVTVSGGIGGTGLSIGSIPEPSTYALILGAVALGFAFRRRK